MESVLGPLDPAVDGLWRGSGSRLQSTLCRPLCPQLGNGSCWAGAQPMGPPGGGSALWALAWLLPRCPHSSCRTDLEAVLSWSPGPQTSQSSPPQDSSPDAPQMSPDCSAPTEGFISPFTGIPGTPARSPGRPSFPSIPGCQMLLVTFFPAPHPP